MTSFFDKCDTLTRLGPLWVVLALGLLLSTTFVGDQLFAQFFIAVIAFRFLLSAQACVVRLPDTHTVISAPFITVGMGTMFLSALLFSLHVGTAISYGATTPDIVARPSLENCFYLVIASTAYTVISLTVKTWLAHSETPLKRQEGARP
jgi:hypothetical protein